MGIDRSYWVYILASDIGGTLYIGVTNDLVRRVYEHRTNAVPGFSGRYGVHRLVYYEQFGDIEFALRREKRLKKWNRAWKIELIEKTNPNWIDLFPFSWNCESVAQSKCQGLLDRPVKPGDDSLEVVVRP
jgi:putative endonuclease